MLLPEFPVRVQNFTEDNKQLGYTRKEEFIRDAIRFKLTMLSQEYEYIEIPKQRYDLLNEAAKEMNTLHSTAEDFIDTQIKDVLEKYRGWKQVKIGTKKKR